MSSKGKSTGILPTYNERTNLLLNNSLHADIELYLSPSLCVSTPLHALTVTWPLNRTFTEK